MCLNPISIKYSDNYKNFRGDIKHAYNDKQIVPCGKCLICKQNKIEEWVCRWSEQLKVTKENTSYFLTLTYDDNHLNYISTPNGKISTLNYDDVTKFIKRLRKKQTTIEKKQNLQPTKIVYHGCGEYGKKFTKRPHYHILITGCIIEPGEYQKIWNKGLVHVGDNVNETSIKYILKYSLKQSYTQNQVTKVYNEIKYNFKNKAFPRVNLSIYEKLGFKVHNPDFQEQTYHRKDKLLLTYYNNGVNKYRVIEKSFMSKGIGKNYLTAQQIERHIKQPLLGFLYHDIKKNELKEKPLPKYYKELIFNPNYRDENGKLVYKENKQPLKKYRPSSDDYFTSPRYKRQLSTYQCSLKKQKEIQNIVDLIGLQNYINNQRINRNSEKQKFLAFLDKGEAMRAYNLKINKAEMLI